MAAVGDEDEAAAKAVAGPGEEEGEEEQQQKAEQPEPVKRLSKGGKSAGFAAEATTRLARQADVVISDVGKSIGVQFCPVLVPMPRRRQTFFVALFWSLQLVSVLVSFALLRYSRGVVLYAFLAYLAWALLVDDAQKRGGRAKEWYRRCRPFTYFRDYFPISLIKTTDLDPEKNYVFGYHPHGIIGMGAFLNFATDANGFSDLFPGIHMHLMTLTTNFRIPFFRDHLLFLGCADASKESCNHILSHAGPNGGRKKGESIMLVVGGAAEALDAHPGTYNLTLKNRKGFVKVALRNGASLVPVFGFGENDIFVQVGNDPDSPLRKWQQRLQKKMGFSMPLFHGRGVFNYTFGFMPFRKPIVSVVGRPIDVPQVDEPSPEMVDKYHGLYIEALHELWDKHKETLAKDRKQSFFLK